MVKSVITYLLEIIGVAGIIGFISYISWTKMTMGAALSIFGAFFPSLERRTEQGEGKIEARGLSFFFKGGVRILVIISGIVLIVGTLLDASEDKHQYVKNNIEFWFSRTRAKLDRLDESISQANDLSVSQKDRYLMWANVFRSRASQIKNLEDIDEQVMDELDRCISSLSTDFISHEIPIVVKSNCQLKPLPGMTFDR